MFDKKSLQLKAICQIVHVAKSQNVKVFRYFRKCPVQATENLLKAPMRNVFDHINVRYIFTYFFGGETFDLQMENKLYGTL